MNEPLHRTCAYATRRAVVTATGATALLMITGCQARAGTSEDPVLPAGPQPIARASDVPVGGGFITERGVVVTQPAAGDYRAFSSTCTHQGCTVGRVESGFIICECHGSMFRIEDGTVGGGPARRNLPVVQIVREGDTIFRMS